MDDPLPTQKEIREARLEYAFNSLLLVPQIIPFSKPKYALYWLNRLRERGIGSQVIGILIEEKYTYIWVKLKRNVECFGLNAVQRCKIWCRTPTPQSCSDEFLG